MAAPAWHPVRKPDDDPLGDQGRADGSDALDRRPGRMEGRTRGKVGGRNVHRKLPETGWHHRARGWHSGLLHRDAGVGGVTEDRMMAAMRSEEHTSELQSLMRISYAVFCLKTKKNDMNYNTINYRYSRVTLYKSDQ